MNNTGPRGGCLFPLGLMALILAAALGACAPRAQAQQPVLPGKQICSNASGSTVCSFQPVTDASPLPVSATASIAGFNQETVLTPFTATTSGVTSSSFTAGKVIVVTNAGTTNMAYCRLGASATTSGQPIAPNGGWFAFTTVAETQVTCATSTSTTTINVGVGTGLPTGTGGGGGSGGGGGGAITIASGAVASGAYSLGSIASGAMVDLGAQADAAAAGDTSTASLIALVKRNNQNLTTLNSTLGNPIPPQSVAVPIGGFGLCDGANGSTNPCTTVATVKAASTPAAATDKALVVDQRPGSQTAAFPGTLALGATFVKGTTTAMTGTSSTQIIAAVASNRLYITRVACKGDPANAVGTKVQIQDGSGGTVLDTLTVAANGGGEQGTGSTPLFWTTSGNGLYAQNVTTSASVICTASGYSG